MFPYFFSLFFQIPFHFFTIVFVSFFVGWARTNCTVSDMNLWWPHNLVLDVNINWHSSPVSNTDYLWAFPCEKRAEIVVFEFDGDN